MSDDLVDRVVQAHAVGPLRKFLRGWKHDGRDGVVVFVSDDADRDSRARQIYDVLGDGAWRIEWTAEGTPPNEEADTGQSLHVEIAVQSPSDAALVWQLVEQLHAALEQSGLGEADGPWDNNDALALATYGEDADAMFACALPYLEALSLRPINVVRRYGALDDEHVREAEFSLP